MQLYLYNNITRHEDAYALLSYAVRQHWGLNQLPPIAWAEGGKPFFPDYPQFHFNLSHSSSFALCVLDEQPVGVDIEIIRPHHPKLAQRICNEQELDWLEHQPDQTAALCQLWTGKEALAKYHGTGLSVPVRALCAPLPPAKEQDGLLFHRRITPEFCLCVCGHSPLNDLVTVSAEEISG